MFFKPEGIAPAMLTSFDEDGKVNAEVMQDIVDFCYNSGCKSVFTVSSVGEFVHLETDEAFNLMTIVKKAAKGRIPVMAR